MIHSANPFIVLRTFLANSKYFSKYHDSMLNGRSRRSSPEFVSSMITTNIFLANSCIHFLFRNSNVANSRISSNFSELMHSIFAGYRSFTPFCTVYISMSLADPKWGSLIISFSMKDYILCTLNIFIKAPTISFLQELEVWRAPTFIFRAGIRCWASFCSYFFARIWNFLLKKKAGTQHSFQLLKKCRKTDRRRTN